MKDLKKMPIWVCWNLVERDGRATKVPCSASGRTTGSSEAYRSTWVSYSEALAAAERLGFSGVGFIIPRGYFFLDLDHVEPSDPWVQSILDRFGSYTEYSQSGEGIHIYGSCDLNRLPTREVDGRLKIDDSRYYIKHPANGMELYIGGLTNRFAVFTGNAVRDLPCKDCTDAVLTTLNTDLLRNSTIPKTTDDDLEGELFDIVASLLNQKNGDRFRRLYTDGDYSDYLGSDGKPDRSRADLALASMIAFRAGDDPELIYSVIEHSALMRDKWNRRDYRDNTIRKAIESCEGQFCGSGMRPYFIRDGKNGGEYISSALLARYVREHLKYILVRDSGKQGLLIYVYRNGWYQLYAQDMFKGEIKRFIAGYSEELVKMSTVNEVYQQLTTDLGFVSQDELNADESIINVENGLLRVTADEITLLPHSPEVYSTIRIPVRWTGRPAPTPVYDGYLDTLTDGDPELQEMLSEYIGAVLSNIKGYRMKKALFMAGPGNTGKSQLKALVERMLGKGNYTGISLKEIEARFGTGAIYGTRLAGTADMSFMTIDELKTFKKITGGDSLFAEFKGQQAFEYTYPGLLWFCMNRLPRFGGDDGPWVYDRILVVNCPNVIPVESQDASLLDKLFSERDGIFYNAVLALQRLMQNGYRFSEPESVTQARRAYQGENNSVISFFAECMVPWPEGRLQRNCTTGRIYSVYKAWCEDNCNGYRKNAKDFRDGLAEYLGAASYQEITTRRNGNTYYRDYGLSTEAKEQFSQAYGGDFLE